MSFHRRWQDGSKSGDDTWSSSEGTSRPGTGTGNPFTDDDDNLWVLLTKLLSIQSLYFRSDHMRESPSKSDIDRSEGSSSPSTLPDMEHVSPTSSSSTLAGGNPFLEDVVKPFLDYGTSSRSSERKTTSERRKGGDNPFQPAERGRAGRGRAGSDVGSSHVLKEGRGKSEEAETGYSLEGRQPELSSGTHPSDGEGGEMEPLSMDSGVELQFTALMQLPEQPDSTQSCSLMTPKEGKETKRPPPLPPARTTSLAKAANSPKSVQDNEAPKLITNNDEDKEDKESDIQPLCLSADPMRRFAVDYDFEFKEMTDESLEDLEIVQACNQQPVAQDTSDFDPSEDDLSDKKEDEEEETFDFIPMGHSEELSQGKPNDLEDVSTGITITVGNDRDSAVPEFACTHRVSRDPAQPADSEASRLDPGESAAGRRLSADSQSSLLASQHSVRLIPACHAAASDGHQSKSRSRSQLQPEQASEFLNEEMRINMAQPVYSEAHHQVT